MVTWDSQEARFRDAEGRLIREDWIRAWSRRSLEERMIEVDNLAQRVQIPEWATQQEGVSSMSVSAWRNAMREQIKSEYVRQYLSSKPREAMEPADWGRIGGLLSNQYRYLDNFANEVAKGNLSDKQIRARSQMYIRGARQAFERANWDSKRRAGYREVRWVIDWGAENCADCQAFAAKGWQPVSDNPFNGCVPGEGCTICLTNCRCHLEYRRQFEGRPGSKVGVPEHYDYEQVDEYTEQYEDGWVAQELTTPERRDDRLDKIMEIKDASGETVTTVRLHRNDTDERGKVLDNFIRPMVRRVKHDDLRNVNEIRVYGMDATGLGRLTIASYHPEDKSIEVPYWQNALSALDDDSQALGRKMKHEVGHAVWDSVLSDEQRMAYKDATGIVADDPELLRMKEDASLRQIEQVFEQQIPYDYQLVGESYANTNIFEDFAELYSFTDPDDHGRIQNDFYDEDEAARRWQAIDNPDDVVPRWRE